MDYNSQCYSLCAYKGIHSKRPKRINLLLHSTISTPITIISSAFIISLFRTYRWPHVNDVTNPGAEELATVRKETIFYALVIYS
jgi:hypothetical protein